jgi:DNA-binding GntR family transcriptional regulator
MSKAETQALPAPRDVPNLGDSAYAELKSRIVDGRLPGGTAVSEAELALALGLGKAPVRAALARLAQDGLVTSSARRGWRIAPITLADILDVFRLRRELEPMAARLATARGVDAALLKRLDVGCKAGYVPGHAESQRSFLAANRAFHLAIAEAAGSPRLLRVLSSLLDEAERALLLGLALRNRSDEIKHEHQALIDAMASGDVATAERIVIEQIDEARDMVIAALMASPSLLGAEIAPAAAAAKRRRPA